ncbi:MAG: tyrosine-protein phosphatase [Pseudomonadales bacterium]|jgi:protein-tyrosine phosphatase|tara:strand:- start:10585 stop:11352 length:768 start_codon:yes stop_codon:yes gene_type:complete
MTKRSHRFVPIAGSLNFRDFGGYETVDGKLVRTGRLFRCGSLSYIPQHAHADFTELDIGVICDLRRDEEAQASPTPNITPFNCSVRIPIDPGSSFQLRDSFEKDGHTLEQRIEFMTEITREIARDHTDEYRRLFEELLNVDNGFLLHCTAGKDRTGFGAAMILYALGVPEDVIVEDYLLTNTATELLDIMRPMFEKRYGDRVDDASLIVTAGVKEQYLRAALEEVHQHFGSIDGYLEAVGIDQAANRELRSRLLV